MKPLAFVLVPGHRDCTVSFTRVDAVSDVSVRAGDSRLLDSHFDLELLRPSW